MISSPRQTLRIVDLCYIQAFYIKNKNPVQRLGRLLHYINVSWFFEAGLAITWTLLRTFSSMPAVSCDFMFLFTYHGFYLAFTSG